ncbi:MAG: hypothetical protein AAF581_00195 [Planctomycetota bacterium]
MRRQLALFIFLSGLLVTASGCGTVRAGFLALSNSDLEGSIAPPLQGRQWVAPTPELQVLQPRIDRTGFGHNAGSLRNRWTLLVFFLPS